MRRALVTGGAGFIGSHVAERLLAAGDAVTALDDLSTGRVSNLAGIGAHPRFRFVEGCATDGALVRRLVADADVVFHLAAAVGVRLVVASPLSTLTSNLRATETVLGACGERGAAVLVASSSEVYGRGARTPFREDDDLLLGPSSRARWSYAAGKLVDEHLALAWHRERGLPSRVVRIFNTSGPRQRGDFGMVLPRFAAQAVAGQALTVHGDGRQTRTFCHVRDTAEALVRLMDDPRTAGGVFNVGGTEEVAIGDLAARVVAAAGTGAPILHVPHAAAYGPGFEDLPRRVPDVSRLAAATGFAPATTLDEIVRDVVEDARRAASPGGVPAANAR